MSEREKKALEDIGTMLKGCGVEEQRFAVAIFAAYDAGKAAGAKQATAAN